MGTSARLVMGAVGVVLLTACGAGGTIAGSTPQSAVGTASSLGTPAAPTSPTAARATTSTAAEPSSSAGRYVDLTAYRADPAAFESGRVVLFFHATWCPNCRRTDRNLTADPGSIPADLTVVKVDFDTETDLRRTYGVTQQHTFVSVRPDGTERATWTGTDTAAAIAQKAG